MKMERERDGDGVDWVGLGCFLQKVFFFFGRCDGAIDLERPTCFNGTFAVIH